MKKKIILLLLGLFIFLSGCGYNPAEDHVQTEPVIGFSQAGIESSWRKAHTTSIREELQKKGFQVLYKNSYSNQKRQIQDVLSFIAYQVDMIVISPIQEDGWETVLEEAKKAGIPVIIVDRNIQTEKSGLYLTHIGSSFKAQGNRAGLYVANYFSEDKDQQVNVLELQGAEHTSPTTLRHNGFVETIGRNKNITITQTLRGDYIRLKAKEVMAKAINDGILDDIDVLYSHSDEMTLGALEALKEDEARLDKNLVIVSIDAQKEMIDLLKNGTVNCVVECNPFMGWYVANAVTRYFNGDKLPEDVYIPETVFSDQGNLDSIPPRNY